jgi:hypothetical protein
MLIAESVKQPVSKSATKIWQYGSYVRQYVTFFPEMDKEALYTILCQGMVPGDLTGICEERFPVFFEQLAEGSFITCPDGTP